MKKNILISGATGFIGRHLVEELSKKFNLFLVLNRKKVKFKNKNIKYIKFKNYKELELKLKNKKINFIIHSATYFSKIDDAKKINEIINANILLGSYLLELSKKKNVEKFINFATNWENFDGLKDNPKNFYAVSKLCFSKILKYHSKINKITKFYSFYLSDTFGDGDNRDKILPIIKKFKNKNKKIHLISKNIYLNFVNIKSIITAVKIVLNKKIAQGNYCVANNKNIKISDLLNALSKKNVKLNLQIDGKKKIFHKILNLKKIKSWQAKKSRLDDIVNYILK